MQVPIELLTAIVAGALGAVGAWLALRGKLAEVQAKERARVVDEYQILVTDLRKELDRVGRELDALREEFTAFKGRRAWCDGCNNVDRCMSQYGHARQRLEEPLAPVATVNAEASPLSRGRRREAPPDPSLARPR